MSPVDSFEQVPQLRRRDHDDPVRSRWPNKAAFFQALGVERRAQAVMPKNLDQPATLAPKNEKITRMRIALQSLLDSQSQGVHAATHVSVTGRNPHPNARGNGNHRRDRTLTTRANAAASTSTPTTTRSPPASRSRPARSSLRLRSRSRQPRQTRGAR